MRQGTERLDRNRQRPPDETAHGDAPVGEILRKMPRIIRRVGLARAVGTEDRRQVRFTILTSERAATADQTLALHGQSLGRTEHALEALVAVELVAATEQQPGRARRDEAPPRDHASLLSGGTRKRPLIIDHISFTGPASTTITRCTMMNARIAAATMKW